MLEFSHTVELFYWAFSRAHRFIEIKLELEAYAETYISGMINRFCAIAKITCKSKGNYVDAG